LLNRGAHGVIVGTRAIEHPEWLAEIAALHPGRLIVAADVRGRSVVTRGWTRDLPNDIVPLVSELSSLPLAGLLVTAVHAEGRMKGPDLDLLVDVVAKTRLPVFASGGIATLADLRAVAVRGAAGVVIGMALYTGALDPRAVAAEFAGSGTFSNRERTTWP
jgi:phosphoribosylformimino-5-aminoimidazole carboxamide ribotide isomerase